MYLIANQITHKHTNKTDNMYVCEVCDYYALCDTSPMLFITIHYELFAALMWTVLSTLPSTFFFFITCHAQSNWKVLETICLLWNNSVTFWHCL